MQLAPAQEPGRALAVKQASTVDVEHLARGPAGGVGQQEADRTGDVVGMSEAAERQQCRLALLLLALPQRSRHVRGHQSGGDRVDADSARSQLVGQAADEHLERRLARAIGRDLGLDAVAADGRHRDDRAAIVQPVSDRRLRERHRRPRVAQHRGPERVRFDVEQRAEGRVDGDGVDDEVKVAEVVDGRFDERLRTTRPGDVAGDGEHVMAVCAQFGRHLVKRAGITSVEHDLRPRARQTRGGGAPDPLR